MFAKCCSCFRDLGWRLRGHQQPKWHIHLHTYCMARAQKQPWCEMFLDNIDLITDHLLPKDVQHLIRSTNIASEIIKIITVNYESENNLFRFCIELFGSYLKLKYSQTINPSKSTLNRIASQHQDFIKLIIDLFVLYYNLEDREIVGEQVFYKSTLPVLVTHFAFSNEDIHSTVLRTVKLSNKGHIDKIQIQMQRFAHHSISQYSVREELRLNQSTLARFDALSVKVEDRLYSGAIQIIKEIIRVPSPVEKMKLVEGLPKQIESSIVQFYQKHHIKFKKIEISTEDLSSILMFTIIQANQPFLLAHLEIAQLFSFSQTKAQPTLQIISGACEKLQNGLRVKRQSTNASLSEMENRPRKNSDGLNFFDEVSNSHLDL